MPAQSEGALEQALRDCIRGDIWFDPASRGMYATDASNYQVEPVGVVAPRDTDDVCAAVALARRHGVTITPRGGGTGLAGQAVGRSLILDFSKHMTGVLELNVDERWVRVEPGIVRDELNAQLASHALHFAPDPATGNRANIGGMVANNSAGTRSVVYGKTVDHLLATRVLLDDGTVATFSRLTPAEYQRRCTSEGRDAEIHRGVREIVTTHAEEIRRRFPKIMRRVQGYNLDEFVDGEDWNLAKLICGSEGTLGVILDATLNLEPIPAHKALLVPHFHSVDDAIRAVEVALTHRPSAVEILDNTVIDLARESRTTERLCSFIVDAPVAVLIIEFLGDTAEEVVAKTQEMGAVLLAETAYECPQFADSQSQAKVWEVRKSGLGLLGKMKGDRKPIPFIEDAAVPVAHLPAYVERVQAICAEQGVGVAIYAHASVGVIHARPALNLREPADIEKMKEIAERTLAVVMEYGGSWSAEHGDGLVRSPFLERYFGSDVYGALREVKHLFDPTGMMNPGKIVDAPPMDTDLRYGPAYRLQLPEAVYHYRADESFAAGVERCSGVGACRKTLTGGMCPSYMVTRNEQDSTRGRANALRLAMSGQLGREGLHGDDVQDVLDLCVSCKACKSECPSNVDMAKLKAEVQQMRHDCRPPSLRERMVRDSAGMAEFLCGPFAPSVNAIQATGLVRRLLERFAGVSRERPLPRYARRSFMRWHARRPTPPTTERPKVVLFVDTYMNFHEPHVGVAAVELLESCGYDVLPVRPGCCQRPRISHGFLRLAKKHGTETVRGLDAYIRQGLQVVVCEPGCASALTDDLPDLVDDADLARRASENITMIDVFLAREIEAGRLTCGFRSLVQRVLMHGHCHQKSLFGTDSMTAILQRVPALEIEEVDGGCCGMAGSFGYEVEHQDISRAMAERRLAPAIRERAEGTEVIACGFSCRHQIEHITGERAAHWVETVRGVDGEEA